MTCLHQQKTAEAQELINLHVQNIFNPDFQDFIKALNEAGVRYVLIGGYAVILHGYNRTTGDLDIWVERSKENYLRLVRAFQLFGMAVFDMTPSNFLENSELDVFTFGRPPVSIDIMLRVKGLDFEDTYGHAEQKVVEGLNIRLISLPDLLEAKIKSGRNKDFDDLEHLKPNT